MFDQPDADGIAAPAKPTIGRAVRLTPGDHITDAIAALGRASLADSTGSTYDVLRPVCSTLEDLRDRIQRGEF